ncbi:hypothetical protein [Methylobacterium nodulans]|uniref:Uncharacterized protein n=1 Tax=Methylobacterium nodulans (strain LMG 21967 / CNCM I-2342 / ORS 2060) TaxID=460265 RepID=B8IAN6_METNO|nr:hypothetical protein [Methylobacterium nodulans]ACL61081.1 hypothetical protein Mnod_6276 [Methylobacterium nodulans ORS 2060]
MGILAGMAHFTTHRDVIDALGGAARVAARYGGQPNSVYAWLAQAAFPAKTYLTMIRRLQRAGHTAPPELWSFAEEIGGAISDLDAAAPVASRAPAEWVA